MNFEGIQSINDHDESGNFFGKSFGNSISSKNSNQNLGKHDPMVRIVANADFCMHGVDATTGKFDGNVGFLFLIKMTVPKSVISQLIKVPTTSCLINWGQGNTLFLFKIISYTVNLTYF